jgi:NAD(P)H-hydrate repair Nnr-like enzyme with NAD(P)H-hydrate epimerase domain
MSTLPAWLEALPDAQTMREVDRWAIEDRGVASLELMERAGAGVVRAGRPGDRRVRQGQQRR